MKIIPRKLVNIYQDTVIPDRMSDADYIKHLENRLSFIDNRVEEFRQRMDQAAFSRDNHDLLKTYSEVIHLLRIN